MGGCNSTNNIIYNNECPICYENMNHGCREECNCRTIKQTLISPCCHQLIHGQCWTKCLNLNGKCPLCRHKHIPDHYMDHIKMVRIYSRDVSYDQLLSITHLWARDGRESDLLGNNDVICFTDNLYWK